MGQCHKTNAPDGEGVSGGMQSNLIFIFISHQNLPSAVGDRQIQHPTVKSIPPRAKEAVY